MSDWRETLPDTLKVDPALKDFKDVASLASSYVQTKALVGASIRPPSEDAGEQAVQDFAKKLQERVPGIRYRPNHEWDELEPPADPKAYLKGLEIPEGVKFDQDSFMAAAKEMGLTKAQAKKFVEAEIKRQMVQADQVKQAEKALRTELGQAYEDRVNAAKATAIRMGLPEAELQAMTPAQLKAWISAAQRFGGESREVAEQGGGAQSTKLTPVEAKAQIEEIQRRPEYFDPSKGRAVHASLVNKVKELLPFAYPELNPGP